ncbi:DNA glycosylase [Trametes elegans]|nr:DNA glycosylase [Trametes elegans]
MTAPVPLGFHALPLPLAQLSLAAVLKCGQSFRWSIFPLHTTNQPTEDSNTPTHEYRLCLRDRVVCLRQSPDTLFYRSVFPPTHFGDSATREAETLLWIRDYFQLDTDLLELYRQWGASDPVFRRLRDRFEGIRVLRQDPFENLISFICSSNNNISRITKMVKSLCQHYSPLLVALPPPDTTSAEEAYHPFPPPSALATPEVSAKLRALGFGYRADFIQKTAAMLVETHGFTQNLNSRMEPSEEWLMTLRALSTAEARTELLKFRGVGRKVADCVLLMSLDKRGVIPVDTHVHQIAVKHYDLRSAPKTANLNPKLYDEVSNKLSAVWGEYAGWAHSVLFTSDLKSFASYGLPSTPPTPSLTPDRSSVASQDTPSIMTPTTEGKPTTTKRKRKQSTAMSTPPKRPKPFEEVADIFPDIPAEVMVTLEDSQYSLADRVKRRRRGGGSVLAGGATVIP